MARRGRFPRIPKPPRKKVASYTLVDPSSEQGKRAYAMVKALIEEHHEELTNARIAVAWNHTWKPDVDGRCKLGHCKKAGDLDRELAPYDFVILLRHDFWTSVVVTDEQRRALLDHELCYATVKYDKAGEPAVDERGRTTYRIRKHDIEEFTAIVERHGRYTRDLERFYAALKRGGEQKDLFEEPPKPAKVGATPKELLHQVAAAAGEVRPSEPHAFAPTGAKGLSAQMCIVCGAGQADPVHESASMTVPGVGDVTVAGPGASEIVARMAGNGKGHGPRARANARRVAKAKGKRRKPEARA